MKTNCLTLIVFFIISQSTSAQLEFADRILINRKTAEVGVADFDMDGHPDIAISNGEQRWYAGPDFNVSHVIGYSDGLPYAARVADVNGDGWADLVTSDGTRNENEMPGNIYLYLNPGPDEDVTAEWQRIVVYTGQVRHQNDMRIVDIDGDGKLDIIEKTWSSERVVISFQNSDITTWTTRSIDSGETGKPEGISAGDLDGDGDMEIVLSGVYWNCTGDWRVDDYDEYLIDNTFILEEVKSAVGDIDNDGDNDIYMGSCEGTYKYLAWYENTGMAADGSVNLTKHYIKENTGKYHMVDLIDIDFDGDLDLATGKSFGDFGAVIFYNEDNGTSWTESVYDPSGNLYTGIVADLDADGDYDVVGPSGFNKPVYYYINETPGVPPIKPSNTTAELIDGQYISLTWTDNSDNEGIFETESKEMGTWVPFQNTPSNITSLTHENTQPSSEYQYRVRATNGAGVSEWDTSNVIITWSQVNSVNIMPSAGDFVSPPTITMSISDGEYDKILYTINGATPDSNSIEYTSPFILPNSATVKAYAVDSGQIASEITMENYNVAINGNFPPKADAGTDQSINELVTVFLDGAQSADIDDPFASLQFLWTQIDGPSILINGSNNSATSFIPQQAGTYSIELAVSDEVVTNRDTINITISDFAESLIAYWKVDEVNGSIAQEEINDNDANLSNGVIWIPNGGKQDGCLYFDGENQGKAESPSINVQGDQLTISFWMKTSSYDKVEGRMISKATGTSANDHIWMVSQNGGSALRFRLNTSIGATTTLISNTGEIPLDEWIFVTARYDGVEMVIFRNATQITSTAKTGAITQSPASIAIGNQPSGAGDRPYEGWIDEVRIYNSALSQAEITNIYENTCSNFITVSEDITEDTTIIAKQEIMLNNVVIENEALLTLKAKKIVFKSGNILLNGSNLNVIYAEGCDD